MVAALRLLGVEPDPARAGWQPVRCWRGQLHTDGDRRPSASVNLSIGHLRCHGCGWHGNVRALELEAGTGRPGRRYRNAAMDLRELSDLATQGGLDRLLEEHLYDARRRLGRPRLHLATVARHFALALQAVAYAVEHAGDLEDVRLSAADAMRSGVNRGDGWKLLTLLLPRFGIRVTLGESGRGNRWLLTRLSSGPLNVSTITVDPEALRGLRLRVAGTVGVDAPLLGAARRVARYASAGTLHDGPDVASLGGRPACAEVLAAIVVAQPPAEAPGWTIELLATALGRSPRATRRHTRRFEGLGWIRHAGETFEALPAGEQALERYETAGRKTLAERARKLEQSWWRVVRDAAIGNPAILAPWVPHPHQPGLLLHSRTGEIRTLDALRRAA